VSDCFAGPSLLLITPLHLLSQTRRLLDGDEDVDGARVTGNWDLGTGIWDLEEGDKESFAVVAAAAIHAETRQHR